MKIIKFKTSPADFEKSALDVQASAPTASPNTPPPPHKCQTKTLMAPSLTALLSDNGKKQQLEEQAVHTKVPLPEIQISSKEMSSDDAALLREHSDLPKATEDHLKSAAAKQKINDSSYQPSLQGQESSSIMARIAMKMKEERSAMVESFKSMTREEMEDTVILYCYKARTALRRKHQELTEEISKLMRKEELKNETSLAQLQDQGSSSASTSVAEKQTVNIAKRDEKKYLEFSCGPSVIEAYEDDAYDTVVKRPRDFPTKLTTPRQYQEPPSADMFDSDKQTTNETEQEEGSRPRYPDLKQISTEGYSYDPAVMSQKLHQPNPLPKPDQSAPPLTKPNSLRMAHQLAPLSLPPISPPLPSVQTQPATAKECENKKESQGKALAPIPMTETRDSEKSSSGSVSISWVTNITSAKNFLADPNQCLPAFKEGKIIRITQGEDFTKFELVPQSELDDVLEVKDLPKNEKSLSVGELDSIKATTRVEEMPKAWPARTKDWWVSSTPSEHLALFEDYGMLDPCELVDCERFLAGEMDDMRKEEESIMTQNLQSKRSIQIQSVEEEDGESWEMVDLCASSASVEKRRYKNVLSERKMLENVRMTIAEMDASSEAEKSLKSKGTSKWEKWYSFY